GQAEPLALADHYRRGKEPAQALPLYLRAAEDAGRVLALPEARQHCAQAKAALDELDDTPAHRRRKIDVLLRQVQFGLIAESSDKNMARLSEARAALHDLSPDAESALADQRRGAWIDMLVGRLHYYQNQARAAIEAYQRVLPVAEALGDEQLLAIPLQLIG